MKNKIALFETFENFPFEPIRSNNSNNAIISPNEFFFKETIWVSEFYHRNLS
jgi:hypothetical protein